MNTTENPEHHDSKCSCSPLSDDSIESLQAFCNLRTLFRKWINESYQRQISLPIIGQHDELSFVRPWIFHYLLTGEPDILDKTDEFFRKWKEWADREFTHGYYPENAEEHHHTENFTRVTGRLWIFDSFRNDYREALIDMVHHIGNWNADAPEWYDWDEHRFVARWLGTVRVGPDSEHSKHAGYNGFAAFRYLILSEQAYLLTGEQKYLDLVTDYTDKYCEIIREYQHDPEGVPVWYGKDWNPIENAPKQPKTFISGGAIAVMLDLYRMFGEQKYADCARILMEKACQAHLKKDPGDGDDIRFCALAASMLCHYRQVTGDTSLDGMVPDFSQEPISHVMPDELEVMPKRRPYAAEFNWMRVDNGTAHYVPKRPAALYALKYQISGDEKFLQTALELARKRLELVRVLGEEGRFHGCARGNIRTVIDEDVLPAMHATAMGLHGITFDGNAHFQPAVAYRSAEGRLGLPPGVAASVRNEASGKKQVSIFNNSDQDETVMIMDLKETPNPNLLGKGLKTPMTLPWASRAAAVYKLSPRTGRAVTFY